jgi:hypothetical protein
MSTNYVKYVTAYHILAEKCLTRFWGKGGWDNGCPAHKYAVAWVKAHWKELKELSWNQVYKQYLFTLRQE